MVAMLKLALICLLVSTSVFAQETIQKSTELKKCPSEVRYDRFDDLTTEFCGTLVLDMSEMDEKEPGHFFSINGLATYSGTVRRMPVSIKLNIISLRMGIGVSKPRFSGVVKIILLTDSLRIVLPLNRPTVSIDTKLTGETFLVLLNKPAVRALITTESVEGRLGSKEFQFDKTELCQFQRFLKEMLPLVPRQSLARNPKPK